jgi:diguanylate cyclase (GGDEF)-like protein
MEIVQKEILNDNTLVEILSDLNARAMGYFEGDLDTGVELLREVFSLAESHPQLTAEEKFGFAGCYLTLGRFQMKQGKFGSAIRAYSQASELYRQTGAAKLNAWTESYIGVAYAHMGEFNKALRALFSAVQVMRREGDAILAAEISNDIGYVYIQLEQPARAIGLLDEVIPVLREANETSRLGWALDTLATAYTYLGKHAHALEASAEALALAERVQSWQDICVISLNRGNSFREIGQLSQARAAYQRSLQVASEHKLRADFADVCIRLADLDLQEGKVDGAIATLLRVLHITEELSRQAAQMDCCRILSQAYEQKQEFAQALNFYKKFHQLKSSIFSAEADQRMRNILALHQLDSLRREAEDFQKQNLALRREIEEQKQEKQMLEQLALTDPLTHALNRRAFYERATVILLEAQRTGSPLTLMMLDVDHFKEVNDQFGHVYGDSILARLVDSLHNELRSGDLLARYGGEEFVILLPGVDREQAERVGERLRVVVEQQSHPDEAHPPVTVSLGAAIAPANKLPDSIDPLINYADEALYRAKQSGRNCCALNILS